jgi:hypothetical protein
VGQHFLTGPGQPLPPRRALPPDVEVPVLPGLGVTWYDRSGSYWARRAAMSVFWLLITAAVTLAVVAILIAAFHRSRPAFFVVLILEAAWTAGMLAFFARRTVRVRRGQPGVPGRRGPLRAATQLLLGLSFLSPGLYLGLLGTSLLAESPAEQQARRQVAGQLSRRGHRA